MKKLLILGVAGAIAAALALAAYGSGDSGGSDSATGPTPSTSEETVAVEKLGDAGRVLVDSTGQALYASDQEADGRVLCTDGCESFWTPVTIDKGEPQGSVPGELGVVERPDGTRQVTYDSVPLYSFSEERPGEVTGDGFVDAFDGRKFTWNVVGVGSGQDSPEPSGDTSDRFGY
jgi:predicted lipoprotein with Yx(FWY)xxD motif